MVILGLSIAPWCGCEGIFSILLFLVDVVNASACFFSMVVGFFFLLSCKGAFCIFLYMLFISFDEGHYSDILSIIMKCMMLIYVGKLGAVGFAPYDLLFQE